MSVYSKAKWAKRAGVVAMIALCGALGVVAGTAATSPEAVKAFCEDDECELGTVCRTNPGGNTSCDVLTEPDSAGNRCKTLGCGVLPEG
jgi:hypothetical protein